MEERSKGINFSGKIGKDDQLPPRMPWEYSGVYDGVAKTGGKKQIVINQINTKDRIHTVRGYDSFKAKFFVKVNGKIEDVRISNN